MAPLHLVGSTRSLFFLITGFCNAKFWGLRDRLRGHVGSRRILFHASLIHFVVSFLSQLKHILVLADQRDHALTFACVRLCSEGKITCSREHPSQRFFLGKEVGFTPRTPRFSFARFIDSLIHSFIYLSIYLFIYYILMANISYLQIAEKNEMITAIIMITTITMVIIL